MIERREHLRLALEPRQTIRIQYERGRQHLERDVAIQFRIAGAIHLAHAPGPDGGDDLIRAEAGAGAEGHVGCGESRQRIDILRFCMCRTSWLSSHGV